MLLTFSHHRLNINNKVRGYNDFSWILCGVIKTNPLCRVISNKEERNIMTEYTFAAIQYVVIVLSNTVDSTQSS